METWRPVVGHEGFYEVSNLGRIRSLERLVRCMGGHLRTQRESVLRPRIDCYGYARVDLRDDGKRRTVGVHRIVAEAFLGAPPFAGAVVNHLDFDQTNNAAANLEWTTPAGNTRHSLAAGRMSGAGRKLTGHAVDEMRRRHLGGETIRALASEFGICYGYARRVVGGQVRSRADGTAAGAAYSGFYD